MSDAKEIFLKDKELSDKWSGWTHGPDAKKVFAFADAELMNEADATMEMIKGARRYKSILENLAETDPPDEPFPSSGLNHDVEPRTRTVSNDKPKPK